MKVLRQMIALPSVAPSLLAAPRDKLPEMAKFAELNGAGLIHFDVMDGKFVPNVSFSLLEFSKVKGAHNLLNDVHIMVEEPWEWAKRYADNGADIVTFHVEACPTKEMAYETIRIIKERGAYAGMSIKPNTPVAALLPYVQDLDLILLMSVEPGKGGQSFIESSLERLREIKELIAGLDNPPVIEIDGGINGATGPLALKSGAEILVAGSYLYGHEDFRLRLEGLLK